MFVLYIFAFVSGLITILAPCIWPLLPIIFSSSSTGGRSRPLGITLGIILSFGLLTLTISTLVSFIPFDPNVLRLFAVLVIGVMGAGLLIPSFGKIIEGYLSRVSSFAGSKASLNDKGFKGGLATGLALGIVWSPCAGPILATIASISATRQVSFEVILLTAIYMIGVGIPLFMFALASQTIINKSRFLSSYTGRIQQGFGFVMIITAILIFTNFDKVLQAKLLDAIPTYSQFLYKLESNPSVQNELRRLKKKDSLQTQVKDLKPIDVTDQSTLPKLGQAPEFVGIYKWLNSEKPLTMSELKGKVVLIDFWTYTCINCIRTLPFVTGWYEKYKDKGFVVVGVHTPEFEFEKKTDNVLGAIKQYKINYPVAQDNDYETWNAYRNLYWPAKYLIDKDGNIRYTHFGEGQYEETEMNIKKLVEELGQKTDEQVIQLEDKTPRSFQTPETYLGSSRIDRFASNEGIVGGVQSFTSNLNIPLHGVSYEGKWDVRPEYSSPFKGSSLVLRFYANKVHLVIVTKNPNDKVKVLLDGKVVNDVNRGQDVLDGYVEFDEDHPDDLYNLIDLKGKSGDHTLRLEFESDGVEVYAFTFG